MFAKPSVDGLKNKHKNETILVLGAGEDLLNNINDLPYNIDECITISANDKVLQIYPNPTYIFSIGRQISESVYNNKNLKSIKISTLPNYSDYLTNRKSICYSVPGAGAIATSLACHLGGNKIILCGFDLFRKNHCDGVVREPIEMKVPLENILNGWKNIKKFHSNHKNIYVFPESPLAKILNKLDKT